MDNKIQIALQQANLTSKELESYNNFIKDNSENSLDNNLQVEMYDLFLKGLTCEDIRKLYPDYSLGQIIKARIDNEWDRHLQEHIDSLMISTRSKVHSTQFEAISFICDLVSVAQEKFGNNLKKYMKTKNPEDLGDLQIKNINQLETILKLLVQITGQNQPPKEKKVVHEHQLVENNNLTAKQAEKLLKLFETEGKDE